MSGLGSVRERSRGTVLVMVIGLLVMVFVMGSSYLFVARFEREVVRVELRTGGNTGDGGTSSLSGGGGTGDLSASLRLVLKDVLRQLRLDAVGADGIPYNDDLDGSSGSVREDAWDAPGSFADRYERANPPLNRIGDGLLAANEPYVTSNTTEDPVVNFPDLWKWFAVSSLRDNKPRLSYQPIYNNTYTPVTYTHRTDLVRTRPTGAAQAQFYSDADGDGYPDFLFQTQDRGFFTGNDERAFDPMIDPDSRPVALESESAPDELDWESVIASLPPNHKVALRVIGHGGMVLLDKDTPETLLLAATGRQSRGEIMSLGRNDEELDPAMEEANLRRRFSLPPKYDPDASSDTARQVDPRTPFERENRAWLETNDTINQSLPRWKPWLYDFAEIVGASGNYTDNQDQNSYYDVLTVQNEEYDRRHLVTTVAYDDLMRPQRNENDGRPSTVGTSYLDALFFETRPYGLADQRYVKDITTGETEWAAGLLRRVGANGAVPYLPDDGLRTTDSEGNQYGGFTKFSLADLAEVPGDGARLQSRDDYLRVLYGYYRAMLQRWQPAGRDGEAIDPESKLTSGDKNRLLRTIRAGALAVNTWDYFDARQGGGTDDITMFSRRYVPNPNIFPVPEYAYLMESGAGPPRVFDGAMQLGIEGLPFISMAYKAGRYDTDDGSGQDPDFSVTDYAVELFNPWPYPITLDDGYFQIESGGYSKDLPQIKISAADEPGRVNASVGRPTNLVIIANKKQLGDVPQSQEDVIDSNLVLGNTVKLRVRVDGVWFTIDEIDLDNSELDSKNRGEDGNSQEDVDLWEKPDTAKGDMNDYGKYQAMTVRRITSREGTVDPMREWRFAIGVEELVVSAKDTSPIKYTTTRLGLDNEVSAPAEVKPVPLWFNNTGDALEAFPTTGSLLLVNSMAHLRFVDPRQNLDPWNLRDDPPPSVKLIPLATQLVKPLSDKELLDLNVEGDDDDEKFVEQVDNGHMAVFDRRPSQMVVIDEDDQDDANVPWGMQVFDYFTAIPLQRLRYEPSSSGEINSPQTTMQQYRDRYRELFNLGGNQALHLPIAERTHTVQGNQPFGYGAKVRGRVNINLAPWNVLDGLPLVQSFGYAPVPELNRLGGAAFGKVLLTGAIQDHNNGVYTLSPELAQAIVAYREGRRLTLPGSGLTPGSYVLQYDENQRRYRDEPIRDAQSRQGPGFVSLGELATLIAPGTATVPGIESTSWRIDGGYSEGANASYAEAIFILASLADWATVRTNTYTVYATGAEVEEGTLLRGQWTVDRSRCLYSDEQPEVIGPDVVVSYADAASDPK